MKKKRAELTVNTYVTEQRKDTLLYTNRYTFAKKKEEKISFIIAVGKDKFPRFQTIFGGVDKKICSINPQIISNVNI